MCGWGLEEVKALRPYKVDLPITKSTDLGDTRVIFPYKSLLGGELLMLHRLSG